MLLAKVHLPQLPRLALCFSPGGEDNQSFITILKNLVVLSYRNIAADESENIITVLENMINIGFLRAMAMVFHCKW